MTTATSTISLHDPVTTHMRRDHALLSSDQTVGEALAAIRAKPPEGRVIYFYVTDRENRLVGVLPTRRLLLSALHVPLADIMVRNVITIPQQATVLEACEFFTIHRLLAFPVVDAQKRLVGIVDVELYTQELSSIDTHESNEDLFQLIGVHLTEAQQASPLASFRGRFPWLLCNLAGGILAAFLSGIFEAELQRVIALAMFIPVVLALAESVSIQSVSLALHVLHIRPPTWRAMAGKLRSELLTGLLLGVASGLLVGLVEYAWLRQGRVLLCLLVGIIGGMTAAALIGLAMPYVLRLMRRDPRVAAGPIALMLADMITLVVYFNIARWLLSE